MKAFHFFLILCLIMSILCGNYRDKLKCAIGKLASYITNTAMNYYMSGDKDGCIDYLSNYKSEMQSAAKACENY